MLWTSAPTKELTRTNQMLAAPSQANAGQASLGNAHAQPNTASREEHQHG